MNKLSNYDKKKIKQKGYSIINLHTHSQIVVSALSARKCQPKSARIVSSCSVSLVSEDHADPNQQ